MTQIGKGWHETNAILGALTFLYEAYRHLNAEPWRIRKTSLLSSG
jgi:hypothetical protein